MSFLRYTAQQIKFDLIKHHPDVLRKYRVDAKDRVYQFWERNALSIELSNEDIFIQKMDYIHKNPVKAGYCLLPEDYKYSSASYYYSNDKTYNFLTHYMD